MKKRRDEEQISEKEVKDERRKGERRSEKREEVRREKKGEDRKATLGVEEAGAHNGSALGFRLIPLPPPL